MATLYDLGKLALFEDGWVSKVNTIKLYTSSDVEVDSKSVTFTAYGTRQIRPTADVVFSVAAGTNNVAYVVMGETTGGSIFIPFLKDTFPGSVTYNFPTAGTMTIDYWDIGVINVYATFYDEGAAALLASGWENTITQAKLYTSGDVLVDTQSVSFSVNGSYQFVSPDIVFSISAATSGIQYVTLCNASGTAYYKKNLNAGSTYDFPTPGTLTVEDWTFSI